MVSDVGRPAAAPAQKGPGEPSWSRLQILVVGLCFLINMIDGMDILILSYVAPALSKAWNIAPDRLAILFSAGLAGMAIGGLVVAPLADRFGRRPIILLALALMTSGMVASGFVTNVSQLLAMRVVVGVGIGTVLASMAAIVAEYAPDRHRNFAVGLLQGGYPVGATLTGFAAATAIPHYGWQAVLLAAGVVSATVFPIVYLVLPESVQFLARRRPPGGLERANKILARMSAPQLTSWPDLTGQTPPKFGVRGLFADGRGASTLLLWAATVSSFMTLYFIQSWIPKLAVLSGLGEANSIYAGAILNAGSFLGTFAIGWLSSRYRLQRLVIGFFVPAAVALAVFGSIPMPLVAILSVAFLIGFFLQGGFNGLYPLVASTYPPEARSTGLGCAMGVGRIGAVAGPLIGGALLAANTPLPIVFTVFGVPILVAGACAFFVVTPRLSDSAG